MDCRTCGRPMARAIPSEAAGLERYPIRLWVGAWLAEPPVELPRVLLPESAWPVAACPSCLQPLMPEDFSFAGTTLIVACGACGFTETLAKGG